MRPNQFQVDEAWIVFKLNNAPLRTDSDVLFNIVCLMDAASCFLFGNAYVSIDDAEPSVMEFQALLEKAWAHNQQFPTKLFAVAGDREAEDQIRSDEVTQTGVCGKPRESLPFAFLCSMKEKNGPRNNTNNKTGRRPNFYRFFASLRVATAAQSRTLQRTPVQVASLSDVVHP